MLTLRRIHFLLGALFAPSIVFFAFSGILQIVGLHEAEDTDAVQPPAWIVTLASIHKDQHLPRPKTERMPEAVAQMRAEHAAHTADAAHDEHETASAAPAAGEKPAADKRAALSQTLLKGFFLLMAIGLITSAMLGIVIALKTPRNRRATLLMLALGVALPVVALALVM